MHKGRAIGAEGLAVSSIVRLLRFMGSLRCYEQ
jgi:hypothetical protein